MVAAKVTSQDFVVFNREVLSSSSSSVITWPTQEKNTVGVKYFKYLDYKLHLSLKRDQEVAK